MTNRKLNEAEREALRDVFKMLDVNSDGKLNRKEFEAFFLSVDMNLNEQDKALYVRNLLCLCDFK